MTLYSKLIQTTNFLLLVDGGQGVIIEELTQVDKQAGQGCFHNAFKRERDKFKTLSVMAIHN